MISTGKQAAGRAWLDSLQRFGIALGLLRVRRILRALDNPQHAYRSVIVAGTNGKGSTSAMLASIFNAAGLRTGFYSSPPLIDERERWQIAGEWIAPERLEESIAAVREASARIDIEPTYFEALTLIAFVAFARAECELVVLEVGMGGRLDATNVVRPTAAVITPIGMDHTEHLGNTVRKIAREKAGVIHRGAIVLTSNDDPAVLDVIRTRAEKFGNRRFVHVTAEHDTPLAGEFQRRNAALAVRTARELGIEESAIARGVRETRWRGRLEQMNVAGKEIWIDGGHNPHAIERTAPFFDARVARPRLLVFGMMADKDIDSVIARLFPLFDRVIATDPHPPRSLAATSYPNATPIADPDDAFRGALDAPERSIVITGSLYLAGAAIRFFDKIARP